MGNIIEYGIEYTRLKLKGDSYLLIPKKILEGYSVSGLFYSKGLKPLPIAMSSESIKGNKILIDGIMTQEDLMSIYKMNDIEFMKDYYFQEELDYALIIALKEDGIYKKKVKIQDLIDKPETEIYEALDEDAAITLSDKKIEKLLSITDIEELKKELLTYKDRLQTFKTMGGKALSKLVFKDGNITRVETNGRFYINVNDPQYREISNYDKDIDSLPDIDDDQVDYQPTGLSVRGLYDYLRERVIGHEKELKIIATRLIRNTRVRPGQKTKSILVPGPTGTGKTLTFEVAAEYMGLPYMFVNTADLVPQGIVGTSIQDSFIQLLHECDDDTSRAKRAIVVFDEFDKLEVTGLDLKQSIKPIFLKLIEGTKLTMEERDGFGYQTYSFDTSLLNKAFLGAFTECFEAEKTMGFGNDTKETKLFSKQKMYKCGYYDRELITRIPIVVPYYELTFDEMKRALYCKSSELLKEIDDLKRDFGIEIEGIDDFAIGLLDLLSKEDTSMRDLNNLIINAFTDIEFELEDQPEKYHKLVLTKELGSDPTKYDLS